MYRVGLTGGIASGKSTVADMFAALGASVVDTDQIAREVVAPGSPALTAIAAEFGADVVDAAGRLDRAALRRIVFAAPERRHVLERILHPLIRERTLARMAASTTPYVIAVVPLLFETDFHTLVDRTVVVDCPTSVQRERLMRRDEIDATTAAGMLAAQLDRHSRLARADDIIDNSRDVDATRAQVETLHRRLLTMSSDSLPK